MTMTLALLPPAPGGVLDGDAAGMADKAVFAPRTQRWFVARMLDTSLAMDIGRMDGLLAQSDGARSAFEQMLNARSPVQRGLRVIVHQGHGAMQATVTGFRLSGRRILATLDAPATDSGAAVVPVEWRGQSATVGTVRAAPCAAGNAAAIEAAVARYAPGPDEVISILRGCFGAFRAVLTIRPIDITPERSERVVLVRADGTTRSGRLRDLSYPLHALQSVVDVNGDGTQELVVHSFRPAMETWAVLRMTDSVTFTRFASGFTIEKR